MAEETAVAEPQQAVLSVPIGDIIGRKLSTGDEIPVDEPSPEPKPAPAAKPEPVKEAKAKTEKEKPDETLPKPRELPENLFGDLPEPKKDESKTDSEPVKEEAPAELTGDKRKNFERLATGKYEAEKEVFDLRKKLKQAESKAAEGDPGAKAKIEQLEGQLREYSERVSVADVRLHPEFQRQYALPRDQALEFAKTTYQDAGGDPKVIESALQLKGKARADRLDEIYGEITSKSLLGKLERAVDFVEAKDLEIEGVLKNSGEYAKQLKQQDQVRQTEFLQHHEEQTKKDLAAASKVLGEDYNIALFKRTDDPKFAWWNEQLDQMDREAEQLMLKTPDPKELAIASKMAVGFARAWKMYLEERKARIASDKRFADYKSGEPGLGGQDRSEAVTEEDDEKTPLKTLILGSIKKAQALG